VRLRRIACDPRNLTPNPKNPHPRRGRRSLSRKRARVIRYSGDIEGEPDLRTRLVAHAVEVANRALEDFAHFCDSLLRGGLACYRAERGLDQALGWAAGNIGPKSDCSKPHFGRWSGRRRFSLTGGVRCILQTTCMCAIQRLAGPESGGLLQRGSGYGCNRFGRDESRRNELGGRCQGDAPRGSQNAGAIRRHGCRCAPVFLHRAPKAPARP
jgi:hypothetical protein